MIYLRLSLVLITYLVSSAALAADLVVGVGRTDFNNVDVSVLELEYHSDPVWHVAGADISVAGALTGHDNGDFFIGVGLSALRPLQNNWFIEASFIPGFFENTEPATDLGSSLEFRSLIGVGRTLKNGMKVSLGLSHKSNADFGSTNPGVNALTLRFRFDR
ncbi:acyloxyacyl hydrolase [uncultured Tateyamaria sp.]|uniref:acyloxyacyl hydrolase n=1 Tax=uncultured Tateyamaria sp. TaxID=455651 RepID=UPI002617C435|nr:acyloxyacyl hydrolase [uncultured Tateyamaria sp.]